ncbi:hypothetical protein MTO96_021259 [Rhipicephalus appendiculatus]
MVSAPNQGPSVKEPAMHADERPGVAERRLYSGVAACESPLTAASSGEPLECGGRKTESAMRPPPGGVHGVQIANGAMTTTPRSSSQQCYNRSGKAAAYSSVDVRARAVAATSARRHTTLRAFFSFLF